MVALLKFGKKQFCHTLKSGCNQLSMLGLVLIRVSKKGPWRLIKSLLKYDAVVFSPPVACIQTFPKAIVNRANTNYLNHTLHETGTHVNSH